MVGPQHIWLSSLSLWVIWANWQVLGGSVFEKSEIEADVVRLKDVYISNIDRRTLLGCRGAYGVCLS